ncbi:DUF6233 domain-containing protein [Streptomyces sp. NPDC085524]|uniref:DUF6233 domain-containing protein n=1 Tax=Streptomyces sp. NPDC085524 TaxID=3365728 RepID=UPI0037D3BBF8
MSDSSPSRLDLLRFLERVQVGDLERTRGWIAAEEKRQAELSARLPPAPPPEWELELDLSKHPTKVHVGGCTMGGKGFRSRPVTRTDALRLLGVDRLEACPYCRPDAELGVLD